MLQQLLTRRCYIRTRYFRGPLPAGKALLLSNVVLYTYRIMCGAEAPLLCGPPAILYMYIYFLVFFEGGRRICTGPAGEHILYCLEGVPAHEDGI